MRTVFSRFGFIGRFLLLLLSLCHTPVFADGVVTNGTYLKVQSGTYFVESGNRSIQVNAVFDIWGYATINGLLSNLGDFSNIIVESDITGTGSLIYNSGTPQATVERYLTDGMWHMVGPPTDNVLTGQYFFNNNPLVWLTKYNESNDTYEYITSLTQSMPRGKGYSFWVDVSKSDVITQIHGNLGSDSFVLNNSSSPALQWTDALHGYNLISNPFSSAINWAPPNWTFNNMEESIWVWDPSSGNFKTKNSAGVGDLPNGIIPSSQAFFIRTLSSAAEFTIPASAKMHDDQNLYKATQNIIDDLEYITLEIHEQGLEDHTDEIWVGFHNNASEDFDNGLDISKLKGDETSPQLYLQEGRLLLTADILPLLNSEPRIVSILFEPPHHSNYQLILNEIEGLVGTQIILEDLFTGQLQDLQDDQLYKFGANMSDIKHRFNLHFNPLATINNDYSDNSVLIYSNKNEIYFSFSESLSNENKEIKIFNIQGQLIYSERISNCQFHRITAPVATQTLIVKVDFPNYSVTKKLFIQ